MIYASVKNTAMGKIVQDLGDDVAAVRVYSPKHPGHYAEFSLDDNGLLKVTYDNGNSSPMPTPGAAPAIPEND